MNPIRPNPVSPTCLLVTVVVDISSSSERIASFGDVCVCVGGGGLKMVGSSN